VQNQPRRSVVQVTIADISLNFLGNGPAKNSFDLLLLSIKVHHAIPPIISSNSGPDHHKISHNPRRQQIMNRRVGHCQKQRGVMGTFVQAATVTLRPRSSTNCQDNKTGGPLFFCLVEKLLGRTTDLPLPAILACQPASHQGIAQETEDEEGYDEDEDCP
jgi:hypothetical protein